MLDGQGSEMGISDEVPSAVTLGQEPSEDLAVPRARVGNPGQIGLEPIGDELPRFGGGQWLRGSPRPMWRSRRRRSVRRQLLDRA